MRGLLLGLALLGAEAALAAAPELSQRPVPRPGGALVQPLTLDPSGSLPAPAPGAERQAGQGGLAASLRPSLRPRRLMEAARARQVLRARGAVCGDPGIQGEVVGRVAGRIRGYGIERAVKVRSVSDVTLSQPALMDCRTAAALKGWLEGSAKPTLARIGGGLSQLRVAAHYVCRTRNHQAGAKISEHGKGRAIDISGFRLRNGTEIDVLRGWHHPGTAKHLRRMHRQACGPFGTVLGPEADRFHRDHFHFDTARYRSGGYCR